MPPKSLDISTTTSISTSSSPAVDGSPPFPQTSKETVAGESQNREDILRQYLVEREKFVKYIERRQKKFVKRSKEDYDAARWGKVKPKKPKKPKPSSTHLAPEPVPPVDNKDTMIASTSARTVARTAVSVAKAVNPAGSRTFASTASVGKGKKNQDVTLSLDLPEATRVLRALEVEKPNAAYTMTIYLTPPKKGQRINTLRGRVVLPFDTRKSSDVLLVFAERNSASARLAREAGVAYVGADELFEPLKAGEINPTKVLTTPGMLGPVTAALGRFLGPKGMMPTVKRGGVGEGEDLVAKINEARGARDWTSNDEGIIRTPVGRATFPLTSVEANCRAFMDAVKSSMTTNTSGNIDENLISRRQLKNKKTSGIDDVFLQTSNTPRISLREL